MVNCLYQAIYSVVMATVQMIDKSTTEHKYPYESLLCGFAAVRWL